MSRTPAGGLIGEGSQPLSLSKYMRSRLARAMASGAHGQIIQFGLQLIGVPFMIAAWGVERFGIWLILMTVPSYLAVAYFGFTGAASNEMSMSTVRGDRHQAVSIYQALRLLLMILAVAFMTLLLLALAVFGTAPLDFAQVASNGHAVAIVLVMAAYGLVAIANGSVIADFRADDRYATGSSLFQTIYLAESIAQLASVAVGGGLLDAALALCAVRVLGSIAAILLARGQVGWIIAAPGRGTLRELRALLDPAMAGLAIPPANAIMQQSSVLTLSAAAWPAAVPVFSAARTLTRFPLQIGQMPSNASITRFSVVHAASDVMLKARLAFAFLARAHVFVSPADAPRNSLLMPFIANCSEPAYGVSWPLVA